MATDAAARWQRTARRRKGRAVRLSRARPRRAGADGRHPDRRSSAGSSGSRRSPRSCSRSRAGTASAASRTIKWIGTRELPPDRRRSTRRSGRRVEHNLIWLAFLTFVATPFGLLLAYLLDKEIRGSRIYQSIFFLPVVLSLAIIGFIWQLVYSPTQGLINNIFGDPGTATDRLARRPEHQPVGGPRRRRLAPRRLHHDPLPGRAEGASTRRCARPRRSTARASGTRSARSSSRRCSRSTS